MLKLQQRGNEANIGGFKELTISMKWTTAADFDLAAVYEGKDGKQDIVYFGKQGNLDTFPYMQLSDDKGVGDTGGENEEIIHISRFDQMNYVWVMSWDYGKIQKGEPARFKGSDVFLSITDDKKNTLDVSLDTGDIGNVALIATIDNTNPVGVRLINSSKAGLLKGLKNLQQLMDMILKDKDGNVPEQDKDKKEAAIRIILE